MARQPSVSLGSSERATDSKDGASARFASSESMSNRSQTALRSTCPRISSIETSPLPFRLFGGLAKRGAQLTELASCQYRRLAWWTYQDHPVTFYEHGEAALPVDDVAAVDPPDLATEGGTMQFAAMVVKSGWRRADQFHSLGFPPCSYAYNQLHWWLGTQIGAS